MPDAFDNWRLPDVLPITAELNLRAWRVEDADEMAEVVVASLRTLLPWTPWAAQEPIAPEERIAMLERWVAGRAAATTFNYAIVRDGSIAGSAGLMSGVGPAALEIGYWVHIDHQGAGLATAAARALTGAAFAVPSVARVEIHNDKANAASAAVPAKLGYRLVDEYERAPEATGESGVFQRWLMSSDDWI